MNFLLQRYRVSENPQMTERRIELLVVLLIALLLLMAAIGVIRMAMGSEPAVVLPAQDTLSVRTLRLDESLDSTVATAILERPLFWEGRRPLEPPPVVTGPTKTRAQAKLAGVSLQGVYGSGESLGLIATVDGKFRRIVSGQSVKGWQFTSYENGVATFSSGGRETTLELELDTPNVRVAQTMEPEPAADTDDPEPATKAVDPGRLSPEDLQKFRNVGGGLSFGGTAERSGKQSQ